MALVINHNLGSEMALSLLEKNQNALGKDLKAAASGAKINDASDGASEFAISRRLEIEERGLGQDIQNVKTGGDILAVAEGGIRDVIENLRDMKKLAINAANDTNTDADRATIEKEFASRMETITDIAATTNYNGKLLLAGDYYPPKNVHVVEKQLIGFNVAIGFTNGSNTNNNGIDKDNALRYVVEKGSGALVNKKSNPKPIADPDKGGDAGATVTAFTGSPINVKLDFSNIAQKGVSVKQMNSLPFTVLCGTEKGNNGCEQYIEFNFDNSIKTSDSKCEISNAGYPQPIKLTIGTAGLKSVKDIPKAIFEAVSSKVPSSKNQGKNTQNQVYIDYGGHYFSVVENNGDYYFSKNGPPLCIYNGSMGGENPIEYDEYRPGNSLVIHDTTHASNAIHVFIDSMHPRAITGKVPLRDENGEIYPLKDQNTGEILKDNDGNPIPNPVRYRKPDPTLEDAHVRTRKEALEALDILDMAMNYALDQITDIGAYRMRLEQDENKITIQQESAIGSKSTIQDADMAATMESLTKNNVLSQATQLMLAQSNQNASRVLSLLQ